VNHRTDSVRTLRGCIVFPKGNDRVHHDLLLCFPEILARRERLSENIFARSPVTSDSTGTTSGLIHNNLMMTCENRNVILISLFFSLLSLSLSFSGTMRGFVKSLKL